MERKKNKNMKMALVKNPSKTALSLSGGKVTRRRNPSNKLTKGKAKAVATKRKYRRNPAPIKAIKRRFRARRNPGTFGTVLTTALFAGAGVAAFDYLLTRLLPAPVAPIFRIGSKVGLGFAVAEYGAGLPLIGKYNREIGLVFVTLAVVDGLQTYVMPMVQNTVSGFIGGGQSAPIQEDAEMSDYLDTYDDEDEDY